MIIKDDQLFETDSEEFMIILEPLTEFEGRISALPYLTIVTIKDNDSKYTWPK